VRVQRQQRRVEPLGLDVVEQCFEAGITPTRLYYASGSRGTQAGLTLGAALSAAPYRVYGVAVSAGEPEKIERAKRIGNEAASRLGLPERLELNDLFTDQDHIGEGYGIPTKAGLEAIRLLARTEAILLSMPPNASWFHPVKGRPDRFFQALHLRHRPAI